MKKTDAIILFILTIFYFCIELIVNFSIYQQLSSFNDIFTAESMELWGKIISGLGLALILTRLIASIPTLREWVNTSLMYINRRISDKGNIFVLFILVCAISIPTSFFLQNSLISYVVKNSTAEDRNKAILITAAHNTLVPFYNMQQWGSDKSTKITTSDRLLMPFVDSVSFGHAHYKASEKVFIELSKPINKKAEERLDIHSKTEKAFFSYKALNTNIDEELFKSVIKDSQLALYDDEKYTADQSEKLHSQDALISSLFFGKYAEADRRYDGYKKYKGNLTKAKAEADKQWREGMNEALGFKTTLRPNTNWNDFSHHKDIKKWFEKETGIVDLYPLDPDFEKKFLARVKNDLPGAIIPAYMNTTGEPSEQYKRLTDSEVAEQGAKAYKAVVMPIIALGVSALFLILNIILLVRSFLDRVVIDRLWENYDNKVVYKWFADFAIRLFYGKDDALLIKQGYGPKQGSGLKSNMVLKTTSFFRGVSKFFMYQGFIVLALVWLIFSPVASKQQSYTYTKSAIPENAFKWLYHHEQNLIKLYDYSGIERSITLEKDGVKTVSNNKPDNENRYS